MTYQGRPKESGSAVNGNRDVRGYVGDAFTDGAWYSDTPASGGGGGVFKTTFTLPAPWIWRSAPGSWRSGWAPWAGR